MANRSPHRRRDRRCAGRRNRAARPAERYPTGWQPHGTIGGHRFHGSSHTPVINNHPFLDERRRLSLRGRGWRAHSYSGGGAADFCKAGTVNPDFQEVLDPSTDAKIADMWVASDVTVVEGMGDGRPRVRGVGSTAAWAAISRRSTPRTDGCWNGTRRHPGLPGRSHTAASQRIGGTGTPPRPRVRRHRELVQLEFAVDGYSVVSSSDLGAPAASGQVGIAVDTDGCPHDHGGVP